MGERFYGRAAFRAVARVEGVRDFAPRPFDASGGILGGIREQG